MTEKNCVIQRPTFGFMLQKPMPAGLSLNGAMELSIQQVAQNNHELRQWGAAENFELYCIYCGIMLPQELWVSLMTGEIARA